MEAAGARLARVRARKGGKSAARAKEELDCLAAEVATLLPDEDSGRAIKRAKALIRKTADNLPPHEAIAHAFDLGHGKRESEPQ